MTTLKRVNKEDLEDGKYYIYRDKKGAFYMLYSEGVLYSETKMVRVCQLSGQFYGPIELEE